MYISLSLIYSSIKKPHKKKKVINAFKQQIPSVDVDIVARMNPDKSFRIVLNICLYPSWKHAVDNHIPSTFVSLNTAD